MAHPKAVPVALNGSTKYLVYDFNALCALLDEGVDAFRLSDTDLQDVRVIRKLVWAGLLESEPSVTLAQVGSWLDLSNLVAVAEAFTAAFARSSKSRLADPGDPQ